MDFIKAANVLGVWKRFSAINYLALLLRYGKITLYFAAVEKAKVTICCTPTHSYPDEA